ncbi:MAG TPA: polyprenyl synthetase family protein [Chloroflexota bacterium]
MGKQLDAVQNRYGDDINRALRQALDGQNNPRNFLEMMRYQLGIARNPSETAPGGGGKRFRPALCLLACEAAGGQPSSALQAAAAIELLHNFSLIHDDIEDHDPSRRHRPTVWKVWGEPHAINAGDGMFALSCQTLTSMKGPSDLTLELAHALFHTSLQLTSGQYLDMTFEAESHVSTDQYLDMINMKTASLIEFALWCGGRIAGAECNTCDRLRDFGLSLGRAFQIYDDIQGIWATSEQTGKETNKDLVNRKKTLPVLIAWERATREQTDTLNRFFDRREGSIGRVRDVLDATDARVESTAIGRRYLEKGLEALRAAHLLSPYGQELEEIATEITGQ